MTVSNDDINMNIDNVMMDEAVRDKENVDPNTQGVKRATRQSKRSRGGVTGGGGGWLSGIQPQPKINGHTPISHQILFLL